MSQRREQETVCEKPFIWSAPTTYCQLTADFSNKKFIICHIQAHDFAHQWIWTGVILL